MAPRSLPVLITCRDRATSLVELVSWLERAGHDRIYLVDNDSRWPPLLEFLENTSHTVIRLKENLGYLAPWEAGLVDRFARGEPYVVTDPDVVPDESCPFDAAAHLASLLVQYPVYRKAVLGLRIDDLPEHFALREAVLRSEASFWRRPVRRGLYHAWVDTTFAVYRAGWGPGLYPALRTGKPYLARHLGWYLDSSNPTEEQHFYQSRARSDVSGLEPHGSDTQDSAVSRLRWLLYRWRFIVDPFGRPRRGPTADPCARGRAN